MTHFLDDLRSGLTGFSLKGRRVLAAVSGGADSVAMLRGLRELQDEFSLYLTAAHLDHRLAREELHRRCRLGPKLLCRVIRSLRERTSKCQGIATRNQTNLGRNRPPNQIRIPRTNGLSTPLHGNRAAHSADDQAETILHHILRGTGLAGLKGIPRERRLSANLRIIRPLLETRRRKSKPGWRNSVKAIGTMPAIPIPLSLATVYETNCCHF